MYHWRTLLLRLRTFWLGLFVLFRFRFFFVTLISGIIPVAVIVFGALMVLIPIA